ncbi:MAG TPA: class I SAM-dependent methyltransferase [Methanoregulaceae archaeon]|nr:MAG: class I SAM-dependent methyltransferase [Methanolinea sp.]HON80952.1 class I SAM-dependent methyltransferase [Methanoregulaceae archaeon]HPD09690.1 class I SAM-dependent methyltransferase [Methanoregulaceae archaeon]HRT15724.1 class I SAM-dependent methyltransferase [Methanoregulaceae archaeon]HRU31196.1 class I SAM-dependent methyltransferase [Methanoregulaceae archaeon]
MKYPDMDKIYRTLPLDSIPWNIEIPPAALVGLVEQGRVLPCKAVDLGCGAGNYAIWLAGKGFEVTGIDSSPTAIAIATKKAAQKGAMCRFVVADLLGDLHELQGETFDFAYDWELLHHIFPQDRERYIRNVSALLGPGGKYFSVCFSKDDPQFGGSGRFRKTRIGTILYFSSEPEIRDLLEPFFSILDLKAIEIGAKSGTHIAICSFAERR